MFHKLYRKLICSFTDRMQTWSCVGPFLRVPACMFGFPILDGLQETASNELFLVSAGWDLAVWYTVTLGTDGKLD